MSYPKLLEEVPSYFVQLATVGVGVGVGDTYSLAGVDSDPSEHPLSS